METDERGLVKCRTCNSRTLPTVAAKTWGGINSNLCPLCMEAAEAPRYTMEGALESAFKKLPEWARKSYDAAPREEPKKKAVPRAEPVLDEVGRPLRAEKEAA